MSVANWLQLLHRRRTRAAIVCVAIIVSAATAAAHDTWLLPSSMQVPVGRPVMLDLTSGVLFPNDDFAIVATRVRRSIVRLGAITHPLPAPQSAPKSLRYQWTPAVAGVASIGIELAPKTLTLAPDKIEEYFSEINASATLRKTWSALGGKKQWIELYSKHATTFVRVGSPSNDSSWLTPLGLDLEIVPLVNPTQLHAGDTLVLRVLRAAKPMQNFAVGAIWEDTDNATFVQTDASGRVRVALKRGGKLLINGTDLRRSTNPAFTWESDFVTLTLAVAAKNAK